MTELTPAQLRCLDVAVKYAAMQDVFRQPDKALARAMELPHKSIADSLNFARKLGYLSSRGRGRKGGTLTPLGEQLASSEQYRGTSYVRTVTVGAAMS